MDRFLKYFFYHLYSDWAWIYDWVADSVSVWQWKQWVYSSIPYLSGPDVLELGHGPGHLQRKLIEKGYRAYGIDASSQMGRIAYQRINPLSLNNPTQKGSNVANLVRTRAEQIPFADESFNSIVATFPTDFIFSPDTLSSIHRVLKPGGQLIILLSAWVTGKSVLYRIANWLFRVTGESGDWDRKWNQPIQKAGLEPSVQWIELKNSRVLMVRATRPNSLFPLIRDTR